MYNTNSSVQWNSCKIFLTGVSFCQSAKSQINSDELLDIR